MKRRRSNICYKLNDKGKIISIYEWNHNPDAEVLAKSQSARHFPHHTTMWDINFLKQIKEYTKNEFHQEGIFDPNIRFGEDLDVTITTAKVAKMLGKNITFSPNVAYFYRVHELSITGEPNKEMIKSNHERISTKHNSQNYDTFPLFYKLTHDLPWSLGTHLPEGAKKFFRPIRDSIKANLQKDKYSDLQNELSIYLKTTN